MIDILYVAWNRLAFTEQSFAALVANTDWTQVERLFVHDDGSIDGTAAYLATASFEAPTTVVFSSDRVGGPVATMNWYLDQPPDICENCEGLGQFTHRDPKELPRVCHYCDGRGTAKPPDVFAKIDNDFVVCPGWLGDMLDTMTPELDVLGMEPFLGGATLPPHPRTTTEAGHIGGKGLIRRRVFDWCRPQPGGVNGYQGWTQYQQIHPGLNKAWVTPDLPVFGLDQVRPEDGPWRALAEEYVKQGWQRLWPIYEDNEHYFWWTPAN